MNNATTIANLKSERTAIADRMSAMINGRISERRKASGCASTVAHLHMWRDSEWEEYYSALRPLNASIRKLGGNPRD